jgi:fatty-acyl-CoA synthase
VSKIPLDPAPSAYAYPLLIRHLLHTPLSHRPGQEIVYSDRLRYDYRTLRERIGRLASGLVGLGIRRGDTVAVMDWDSHRYLECFFAVPMIGAVLHTVNIRLSPEQILYTINHAEDDVILVHADFLPVLQRIRDRIERKVRFVLLTDDGARPETTLPLDAEYETMLAGGDPGHPFEDFDENTRATTFYTTGTTGLPKGVYFSHRQLVLHTFGFMSNLGWTREQARFHRDDVYMPLTPMFHVHGWGIPYVATLMGVKQVYPGRYKPERLLELITMEKVTFSHCVPTILHMLLDHPAAERTDLSRLKMIIGGALMPRGLANRAVSRGIDVFTAYGLSETCPLLCVSQLDAETLEGSRDEQVAMRCRTGRPSPLVELRVVDEKGDDVPRDGKTTGEVVVRAPWLTQGYLKERERSEDLWRGGYLHTGDIGYVGADGYLQITDRIKDVIKSGGEWLSSLDLEDIISQHEGVSEVAAIGVPDEKWGERPMVLVVPAPGLDSPLTEEAIKHHVKSRADRGLISSWAVPERVRFVEAIERTSVGKIDKKLLRQKYS